MQGLAKIALQAIDLDGNGVFAQSELAVLEAALSVAKSTSVDTSSVEVVEQSTAPTRRHVGFKELADTVPVFGSRPMLVFYDPITQEYDENVARTPDYDTDISRLNLIVDGLAVRLKDETLRIIDRRASRGVRGMTASEDSGRIRATDYWVVEGDPQERTLTMLREEWKTGSFTDVDVRSEAGRNAFNARVLAYLRSRADEFVPARDVQENVGGTMAQVRRALNRLIEEEQVTWTGKARGTRYRSL